MKGKTRKSNYRYFYKSKFSGNIYPCVVHVPNTTNYFVIAGTRYREGLKEYVGEFIGRLVPEPDNENDPLAIRIEHTDGHHIGYVPKTETQKIREFKHEFPCDCYCIVQRGKDDYGDYYYWGLCLVTEFPLDD